MIPVRFFTKHGCHLCEQVEDALEDLTPTYDLQITKTDIRSDPALFEMHRYDIPIIVIGDSMTLRGRYDVQDIERAVTTYANALSQM